MGCGAHTARKYHAANIYTSDTNNASSSTCSHVDDERMKLLSGVKFFAAHDHGELLEAAQRLEVRHFKADAVIITQGDEGDACYVVQSGRCFATVAGQGEVEWYGVGGFFGERSLLHREPRAATIIASTDVSVLRLDKADFGDWMRERENKESLIREQKFFESMTDVQIAILAGIMHEKSFSVGERIIKQGELGHHFFVIRQGECVATIRHCKSSGDDSEFDQEVKRYVAGDIFGEKALLEQTVRAATVSAVGDVILFEISQSDFESKLGHMSQLRAEQYLADPRKLITDFYAPGDKRGPSGTLKAKAVVALTDDPTYWFAVYRPCSRDSIAKMLGRVGVGKGLNVKGKSSKRNRLSGFVPFLQISVEEHKQEVEKSPPDARTKIYYKNAESRDRAHGKLLDLYNEYTSWAINNFEIRLLDDYAPDVFGLHVPEALMREAYIMKPDISPLVGWETGRVSSPIFMDMNLHAVREDSTPTVVLYQYDAFDPMNPAGLLVAYAEKSVRPVVSDFDTFTVGSKNMEYEQIPEVQAELMKWSLKHTEKILETPLGADWASRWLAILKEEATNGFNPDVPPYGFGDPTSYRLIADIVAATSTVGAVRHGAECFNYVYPQGMDDEFIICWNGYSDPPWRNVTEDELQQFLLSRAGEDYTFPLNPVWPVRDVGWYEILDALKSNPKAMQSLNAWFPPESGVLESIERIHRQYPECFNRVHELDRSRSEAGGDLTGCELIDFAQEQVRREVQRRWNKVRQTVTVMSVLGNSAKLKSTLKSSSTLSVSGG